MTDAALIGEKRLEEYDATGLHGFLQGLEQRALQIANVDNRVVAAAGKRKGFKVRLDGQQCQACGKGRFVGVSQPSMRNVHQLNNTASAGQKQSIPPGTGGYFQNVSADQI